MKYLLILSWLGLGGSERQAINLAQYISSHGGDVTILGLCEPGLVNDICRESGIKCDSMPPRNTPYSIVYKLLNKLGIRPLTNEEVALRGQIHELAAYIRRGAFDVCISYCTTANTVLGQVKLILPEVICIWRQGDAGIYDRTEGLQVPAAAAMDDIISNGVTPHDWVMKAYGRDSHIIYNGVSVRPPHKAAYEWRNDLSLNSSDIVCTMIANLTSAKNHMFLLKVWNELIKTDDRCKLVCAGLHAGEYDTLKKYVDDNGLRDYVRMPGHISDIYGLVQATDICVFAAKSEGSPNGVIECCISGLPVIANDLPEIREIVSGENLPYLFESGDVEQAVESIRTLASDQNLRNRIGGCNHDKAVVMFDPDTNYNLILDLCETLINKHG